MQLTQYSGRIEERRESIASPSQVTLCRLELTCPYEIPLNREAATHPFFKILMTSASRSASSTCTRTGELPGTRLAGLFQDLTCIASIVALAYYLFARASVIGRGTGTTVGMGTESEGHGSGDPSAAICQLRLARTSSLRKRDALGSEVGGQFPVGFLKTAAGVVRCLTACRFVMRSARCWDEDGRR
ncbi:uncharacterized protein BDZ99DRAFT_468320 [Mytilinidion resinicola]|uniref:Uncharacterized protein n=1 Tax=Mytilinidion resinicola TaxID=574789 RepID=A0A6A6Y3F1_9PEZI|nr:uncharacterized protein BDZ99DRAFT_468320 [Mytilinidion resinicola]KAF2803361.1 hypothetical protein BDZ99DRAFT_468320 [Mytilinidion resinicola]